MKIIIISTLTILLLISCNKEPKFEYKYDNNDDLFKCSSVDMELIKEAVYAFEEYLKEYYIFQGPKSVHNGLNNYWKISITNRLPAIEYINPHIIKLRDILKNETSLWITKNDKTILNFNHPIMDCISKNLIDSELKNLFDFLRNSNTFSSEVFLASLKWADKRIKDDKAFETYLVLDTFYARILNVDFNNLEESIKTNRKNIAKKKLREEGSEKIIKNNLELFK